MVPGGIAVPWWQYAVLAGFYVAFFAVPAAWVYRRCRRDGNPTATTWFAATLFMGPLGLYSWQMDTRVQKKRAAQAGQPYDPNVRR